MKSGKSGSYNNLYRKKSGSDRFWPENKTYLKAESVAVSNLHRKHKFTRCAF